MSDIKIEVDVNMGAKSFSVEVKNWRGLSGIAAETAFLQHCQQQISPGGSFDELVDAMRSEPGVRVIAITGYAPSVTISETDSVSITMSKRSRSIQMPPGARAARFLRHLLTPRFFRTHAQVIISEMQAEYIEHLAAGRRFAACMSVIRGHFMLVRPLLRALIPSSVRKLL